MRSTIIGRGLGGRRRRAGIRRWVAGLLALGTAVGLTLVAPGVSGGAAGFKLATSGPASEGPYPWKYPGSGNVKVGTGTTISGQKCTPGTPQFASPYADPCIAKFTGQQRRRHLPRRDGEHHHARVSASSPTPPTPSSWPSDARPRQTHCRR